MSNEAVLAEQDWRQAEQEYLGQQTDRIPLPTLLNGTVILGAGHPTLAQVWHQDTIEGRAWRIYQQRIGAR
jgi:hypothetical protein